MIFVVYYYDGFNDYNILIATNDIAEALTTFKTTPYIDNTVLEVWNMGVLVIFYTNDNIKNLDGGE